MYTFIASLNFGINRKMFMFLAVFALFSVIAVNNVEATEVSAPHHVIIVAKTEYIMPPLRWDPENVDPLLNLATFDAHYWGHHNNYRKKINTFLAKWRDQVPDDKFSWESIGEIMMNIEKVPERFREAIKRNGGGYVNHAIYWSCMMPNNITERAPENYLYDEIEETFGSYDEFKEKFTEKAENLFGSGYVWLSRKHKEDGGGLVLHTTANQDCPLSEGLLPILTIDMWEHAYYLKHQYRKAEYVKDWWMLVDWNKVTELDQWWGEFFTKRKSRDEL